MITEHLEAIGYHVVPGQSAPWAAVLKELTTYFDKIGATYWDRQKIKYELTRLGCPVGRGNGGQWSVGNLSRRIQAPRRWVADGTDKIRLEAPIAA